MVASEDGGQEEVPSELAKLLAAAFTQVHAQRGCSGGGLLCVHSVRGRGTEVTVPPSVVSTVR